MTLKQLAVFALFLGVVALGWIGFAIAVSGGAATSVAFLVFVLFGLASVIERLPDKGG